MNDWTAGVLMILLLRVTIVLLLGTIAVKLIRDRRPSLAIVIARAMLIALWIGPLVVLSGWTLSVAVLPSAPSAAPPESDPDRIDPVPGIARSESFANVTRVARELAVEKAIESSDELDLSAAPIPDSIERAVMVPPTAVGKTPGAETERPLTWTPLRVIVIF